MFIYTDFGPCYCANRALTGLEDPGEQTRRVQLAIEEMMLELDKRWRGQLCNFRPSFFIPIISWWEGKQMWQMSKQTKIGITSPFAPQPQQKKKKQK